MAAKLKDRESIPAVIAEMTREEKAMLLTGATSFSTYAIPRLGIPSATVLDGGTGVNFMQYYGDLISRAAQAEKKGEHASISGISNSATVTRILEAVDRGEKLAEEDQKKYDLMRAEMKKIMPTEQMPGCFPPGMLLGATWDPETVYQCASAVGREMDAYHVDMVLGSPNVNIHRDPMNGRVFEGYSEDPCLAATLAPEFVKGVQDEGLVANVKHFAANNQETHRQNVNETISVRALNEIYFPGFRACVQKGKVKSVMSAYNKINGTACALNHWLLTENLRDRWGFDGLVVSDWGAVYDQVKALAAGNDLDMPGPRGVQPILDAVKDGRLSEECLNRSVERMLNMLLDMPVMKGRRRTTINRDYSRAAAHRAAAEGIVLLKNDGLLPLSKNAKVSFFGDSCKRFVESGGGSAVVYTDQHTSLLETAREMVGAENVSFDTLRDDADAVVISATAWGQEGWDRFEMDVAPAEKKMLLAAISAAKRAGKKTVVILNVAGPVDVSDYEADSDAILCVFFPGMEGGRVAAEVLFGDVNPSGKLPLTFPRHYRDCPTYGNFPGCAGEVLYGEGIFVGYRYYEKKELKPAYPFGFGLSYSTFEISGLRLNRTVLNADENEELTAAVHIKNTSDRAGREVVQLYISDVKSTLDKPIKELKAFEKVTLQPGEEKDVAFTITKEMLESYDPEYDCWACEAGEYRVLVGNSSDGISCEASFTARCRSIYNYSENTMLCVIWNDERSNKIFAEELQALHIDKDHISDALYFFPQKPIGQILRQILNGMPELGEAEKEEHMRSFCAKINALDLSQQ